MIRPLDERIQEKTKQLQTISERKRQIEAQVRDLEAQKKEAERKARTHRLIQIGAVVESVFGRPLAENEIQNLQYYLKEQEKNGNVFTKAVSSLFS